MNTLATHRSRQATTPPMPARPGHRLAVASVTVVAALGASTALGTARADAAPTTASGHVERQGKAYRGSGITRFVTTVDPVTGEWSSRVTFAAPQTAENAGDLILGLKSVGQRVPAWTWTTHTDPAVVGTAGGRPGLLPTAFNGVALPVPGASVGFEPGNTTLVLRVASQALVGIDPDTVGASLNRPGTDGQFAVATAYLGLTAPKSRITSAARHLKLRSDRTVRVPLSALPRRANRRVALRVGKQWVGIKTLPAKYHRRRVATIRLDAKNAARIARAGKVKLSLRTWIDNGSTTTASARATVRR